jgi:hypothetical protein
MRIARPRITCHSALTGLDADDHKQYQLRTEKNVANGYAGLDANALIALAQIPTPLTGKDADTVDGRHLPNTIANVLTDHDKANHDALAIDLKSLTNYAYQTRTVKIGDIRIAWGTVSLTAGADVTVTFPVAFGATPVVVCSFGTGTRISTGQTITIVSISTTGCTIGSTQTFSGQWVAIGPA